MSVLFPKVNKPREWDYRPIYYDPKKDEREQRRRRMQAERESSKKGSVDETKHLSGLHRGSFREARQFETNQKNKRVSRLSFWVALFLLLIFVFYFVL